MDRKRLWEKLATNYRIKHRKSAHLFDKASRHQIRGGSHNLRLFAPFPFYAARAHGSEIEDVDGNTYVDFWQGHFANILGHNPKIVIDGLRDYFLQNQGLTTGFPDPQQQELAELILGQIGAEKIRFTTSGTLATMYAIMLAKAFTKRNLVMKVGGGWHGSQPFVLKGITSWKQGISQLESAGLPSGVEDLIIVTRFNDVEDLEEKFKNYGEQIACFIIEPFLGAGGFIFADKDYIQRGMNLSQKYNSLLIFDEVISGFRFHPAGVQNLYGIKPDLTVLGKAIGGGMPVSAVIGREDVLTLCSPETEFEDRVKFEGGTFSGHPSCMMAGIRFLRHLISNRNDIYTRIGKLGAKVRQEIERIFSAHGFYVRCTGYGDSIAENSSLIGVQFFRDEIGRITSPEQVWNPDICDIELREEVFKLAMLEEGFNIFHGYGAISASHTEEEIQDSLDAVERIARRWQKYNIHNT